MVNPIITALMTVTEEITCEHTKLLVTCDHAADPMTSAKIHM